MVALVEGSGGDGVYGMVYVADGSTPQGSLGTTPVSIDWSGIGGANGVSKNVTPDVANDRIVVSYSGDYKIHFDCSFSGTGGAEFKFHLKIGISEEAEGACVRKLGVGGDIGNCGFDIVKTLAANDQLEIHVETDNGAGTDSMTIEDAHFWIERIGGSG